MHDLIAVGEVGGAQAEVVLRGVRDARDALAVQADGHAGGLGDGGGLAEGEQAAGFVRRQDDHVGGALTADLVHVGRREHRLVGGDRHAHRLPHLTHRREAHAAASAARSSPARTRADGRSCGSPRARSRRSWRRAAGAGRRWRRARRRCCAGRPLRRGRPSCRSPSSPRRRGRGRPRRAPRWCRPARSRSSRPPRARRRRRAGTPASRRPCRGCPRAPSRGPRGRSRHAMACG